MLHDQPAPCRALWGQLPDFAYDDSDDDSDSDKKKKRREGKTHRQGGRAILCNTRREGGDNPLQY